MSKSFLHVVTLLLVSTLIGNPVMASVPIAAEKCAGALLLVSFTSQALSTTVVTATLLGHKTSAHVYSLISAPTQDNTDAALHSAWQDLYLGRQQEAEKILQRLHAEKRILGMWSLEHGSRYVTTVAAREGSRWPRETRFTEEGSAFFIPFKFVLTDSLRGMNLGGVSSIDNRITDARLIADAAAHELVSNVWKHASSGWLVLRYATDPTGGNVGWRLVVFDLGSGITSIEQARQYGYSTAGTEGAGLARLSPGGDLDVRNFQIESIPGQGTIARVDVVPSIMTRTSPAAPASLPQNPFVEEKTKLGLTSTCPFPVSLERQKALHWFQENHFPPLLDQDLIPLFQSDDQVLHEIGLYILERQPHTRTPLLFKTLLPRLQSSDLMVQGAILRALYFIDRQRIWPEVVSSSYQTEWQTRKAVAHALSAAGDETALAILMRMIRSKPYEQEVSLVGDVIQEAMVTLVQKVAHAKNQSVVEALLHIVHEGWCDGVQTKAIHVLNQIGAIEVLPSLEKRINEQKYVSFATDAAAETIIGIAVRHERWDLLEHYARHPRGSLRFAVLEAIKTKNLNKPIVKPILQIMVSDENEFIAKEAIQLLNALEQVPKTAPSRTSRAAVLRQWLDGVSAETILSGNHRLQDALYHLREEEKRLTSLFGEDFGGFIIIGSVDKGYANEEESDIDVAIMTTNPDVVFAAKNALRNWPIEFVQARGEPYLVTVEGLRNNLVSFLFQGQVFQHSKILEDFQRKILLEATPDYWTKSVYYAYVHHVNLQKLFNRFGVSDPDQRQRLQFIAALRHVPPPLTEARTAFENPISAPAASRSLPSLKILAGSV